ncbi:cystathionine beta-lyase family protein involved in aluminum resistance [Schinkia azotoformans MEV2011]|uniref:Cystathionine beta-lyase family protein involved in aluminum resistance n=1 Tax=Schinkia azotoformans MEV2011 TaxID=1348973 RepID=A0A072NRV1_SCHAZ|nr:methionine gamma-lyase family protein [Schinkia azotoformans]KEF39967.1 cystathionine beta-lyase family protein involved in aluminum resistance [Schinkia azotoformans MEV2011]MEC1697265.1 methionine gamma-lyase family protein [Schinkia azotoformans]MEC1714634.1 methionine gamma-lyase family protein [Schinkia azotoformans]MEC1724304.1 methionine gamma-lyase family protein [Schinkia azotoformans]MEC1742915.1 methionine gamma-lyase family protein [Schinkia azotoformans]
MYENFSYGNKIKEVVKQIEDKIKPVHWEVDKIVEKNQYRVLESFRNQNVADFHFNPSTGYGYDDTGRDTLEKVYAEVFGAEAGLVRPQIISGTHAISLSLFGVLRPGDELLYITGRPYDTLEEIVGIRGNQNGSLKEFNISYQTVPLTEVGEVDFPSVSKAIKPNTKLIGIQRSKGYATRPSLTIEQIQEMIRFVKEIKPDVLVFVDNCYGEFVEELEPSHVGADLVAGSLIKNPGGGLAKTGGYIVGKEALVEQCAYRLTAPGLGREAGASLYSLLEMYQGFFLAPHIVGQALKGTIFTSALLEEYGFNTYPKWNQKRTDLIQSVQFHNREMMIAFCQAIQFASPVNAHVRPEPSYMPGYEDDVIMAAGTFIQGASIELTADGPMRPPFEAYVQGGLTYEHVKIALITAINQLMEKQLINENPC